MLTESANYNLKFLLSRRKRIRLNFNPEEKYYCIKCDVYHILFLYLCYDVLGGIKMCEIIDNVSKRQEQLKKLIQRLHRGEDRSEVEAEFKRDFAYVTGAEIAQMEYNLVRDGVSVEEIQSLCDVHASLFQGSLSELHQDVLTINPISIFKY